MRSLYTDPMSWWPLGLVIGGLLGAIAQWYEKRRAATHHDAKTDPVTADNRPTSLGGTRHAR